MCVQTSTYLIAAICNGVCSSTVRQSTVIPIATSIFTTATCPFIDAMCIAVYPVGVRSLMLASFAARYFTMSSLPLAEAMWRGVQPLSSGELGRLTTTQVNVGLQNEIKLLHLQSMARFVRFYLK